MSSWHSPLSSRLKAGTQTPRRQLLKKVSKARVFTDGPRRIGSGPPSEMAELGGNDKNDPPAPISPDPSSAPAGYHSGIIRVFDNCAYLFTARSEDTLKRTAAETA